MLGHFNQRLLVENMMKYDQSQSQLAEASGVSRTTISKITCYRCYPSLDVAIAISRALDLSDDVLLRIFFHDDRDETHSDSLAR